jgi:hypothetical protein
MSIALRAGTNLTRAVMGESSYLENGLLHRCVGARQFFLSKPGIRLQQVRSGFTDSISLQGNKLLPFKFYISINYSPPQSNILAFLISPLFPYPEVG